MMEHIKNSMGKQFTYAISMAVTEEQFNKDLKQPLIDLGYDIRELSYNFSRYNILCNNLQDRLGDISNIDDFTKGYYNRHFIDTYNPKLFLALAGMTDSEDGNIGEWWKCDYTICNFTEGKLYNQISNNIKDFYSLIDDDGDKNGWSDIKKKFTKATKEEIISFFSETETEVEQELIGYRFKNNYYNVMTYSLMNSEYGLYEEMKSPCNMNCNIIKTDNSIINKLTELNLLDTFCEPVYKEIKTISIEEAERILRSIGRTEKIKA